MEESTRKIPPLGRNFDFARNDSFQTGSKIYLTNLRTSPRIMSNPLDILKPMGEHIFSKVFESRKELGLTQKDLAKAVGVTRQTIIAIEKGNYTPSVLLALKIARAFKKTVEQVFEYEK